MYTRASNSESFINTLHDLNFESHENSTTTENWNLKAFQSNKCIGSNYNLPSRRDFYKIMLISEGRGILKLGANTYHIESPAMLFIHPNDILTWIEFTADADINYILLKKEYLYSQKPLKSILERYKLFTNVERGVISIEKDSVMEIKKYFQMIESQELTGNKFSSDTFEALLQLLIVEVLTRASFRLPFHSDGTPSHIQHFFELLEKEISTINFECPIKIRTAKEFASRMAVHPNYLNSLLKKYTGQNVSVHIRERLIDESKILLLQTEWTLQSISYCVGFSDTSNFSLFFKKNTGLTPASYRRKFIVSTAANIESYSMNN